MTILGNANPTWAVFTDLTLLVNTRHTGLKTMSPQASQSATTGTHPAVLQ